MCGYVSVWAGKWTATLLACSNASLLVHSDGCDIHLARRCGHSLIRSQTATCSINRTEENSWFVLLSQIFRYFCRQIHMHVGVFLNLLYLDLRTEFAELGLGLCIMYFKLVAAEGDTDARTSTFNPNSL